jgi:hypothetical protein
MKSRFRFAMPVAAVLMAGCAMNCGAQTITAVCNSASGAINYPYYGTWRLSITIANSTLALQTHSLDIWMDLNGGTVAVSGQPYSGITEQPVNLATGSPGASGNCVVYAQTFSLLQSNGTPYGDRVGQYIIFESETDVLCCGGLGIQSSTYTSKGTVQFTDHDLSGNVLSVASGTFTGVTPNVSNIDNTDPFWSQTTQ